MKNFLKTREQIIASRVGSVNESTFKIGDIYKVKPIVDVPKSLINAFISKAKKEQDVDPRENWSDTDLAELMVNYVVSTFMNVDSIPVEAIMGDKKPAGSVQVQEPTNEPVQPVQTPIDEPMPPVQGTEETKIANIPSQLQVEGKLNENSYEDFLTQYGHQISKAIKQINDIAEYGTDDEALITTLNAAVAKAIAPFDNNVLDFIYRSHNLSKENLAKFALSNQDNFGTEPNMVLEAIDAVHRVYERLGLLKSNETTSEPVETFMINTELTDTIKEHLKENKISFDKSAGILEIKATKSQLETLKKLI